MGEWFLLLKLRKNSNLKDNLKEMDMIGDEKCDQESA